MKTKTLQKRVRKTQKRKGGNPLYLKDAQHKIAELNGHLQQKCPHLRLQLDFVKNLPGKITRYSRVDGPTTRARGKRLMLCLYKGDESSYDRRSVEDRRDVGSATFVPYGRNLVRPKVVLRNVVKTSNSKCISSIEMNIFFDREIIINSRTDKEEEGKKYNKMLRAVVMIVGGFIPGMTQLHSVAENPISAWLLIDNFQVKYATIGNDDFFDYLKQKGMDIDTDKLSKKDVFDFYADKTQHDLISLYVPFTTFNTGSAMNLFMNLVKPFSDDSIVCS